MAKVRVVSNSLWAFLEDHALLCSSEGVRRDELAWDLGDMSKLGVNLFQQLHCETKTPIRTVSKYCSARVSCVGLSTK